jgi:hypothetical protein
MKCLHTGKGFGLTNPRSSRGRTVVNCRIMIGLIEARIIVRACDWLWLKPDQSQDPLKVYNHCWQLVSGGGGTARNLDAAARLWRRGVRPLLFLVGV